MIKIDIMNHRPQTTDHRPQTTDHRPQTTDHRPQTNFTIKNKSSFTKKNLIIV